MAESRYFKPKRSKLALLVDAYGVSNAYVAWRLNVDPSYISGIVSGKQKPGKKMLARLAELFDIRNAPPETLLEQVSSEHFSKAVKAYLGIN
jgi:transcriptional regulator with XRE-family HTH domain